MNLIIDLVFASLLFIIGMLLYIMFVVRDIRKKFPDFGFRQVFGIFLKQDWDTLIVSGLVMILSLLGIVIIQHYKIKLPIWFDSWGKYVFILVSGFAGHWLIYSFLGTSAKWIQRNIDKIEDLKPNK
ncbi:MULTISPECIES: hypothetical protein [unclassified Paraflavitalea]|uniref:hypothetical protein n=1 Tax=unclassified Paraflavitalea TaxID=2798305 RepID=UPI003D3317F7